MHALSHHTRATTEPYAEGGAGGAHDASESALARLRLAGHVRPRLGECIGLVGGAIVRARARGRVGRRVVDEGDHDGVLVGEVGVGLVGGAAARGGARGRVGRRRRRGPKELLVRECPRMAWVRGARGLVERRERETRNSSIPLSAVVYDPSQQRMQVSAGHRRLIRHLTIILLFLNALAGIRALVLFWKRSKE